MTYQTGPYAATFGPNTQPNQRITAMAAEKKRRREAGQAYREQNAKDYAAEQLRGEKRTGTFARMAGAMGRMDRGAAIQSLMSAQGIGGAPDTADQYLQAVRRRQMQLSRGGSRQSAFFGAGRSLLGGAM